MLSLIQRVEMPFYHKLVVQRLHCRDLDGRDPVAADYDLYIQLSAGNALVLEPTMCDAAAVIFTEQVPRPHGAVDFSQPLAAVLEIILIVYALGKQACAKQTHNREHQQCD